MERNITINIEKLVESIYINVKDGVTIDQAVDELGVKITNVLRTALNSAKDLPPVKNKRELSYEAIYDILEPRLNQLGEIRTEAAWQICRHKYGYATVTQAFRKIMLTMVEQGKAKKIKNGHYKIVARNVKAQ